MRVVDIFKQWDAFVLFWVTYAGLVWVTGQAYSLFSSQPESRPVSVVILGVPLVVTYMLMRRLFKSLYADPRATDAP